MAEAAQFNRRQLLQQRLSALRSERLSWFDHWREISDYLLPRSGRFLISDRNRGGKRHNNIYDNTGTRGLRVLAAGMMAGMTSPARPWFRLATPDAELNRYEPVKLWLSETTRQMLEIFSRGNTYRSLHSIYEELGAFGTGASIVLPDFQDVIRHYQLTIGEYCIGTDYRGQVNTLYREFDKRVVELIGEFGRENVSQTVRNLYDRGALDQWVPVVHVIEPRADRDPSKRDAINMAWKSTYYEAGADEDKFLRESGFKDFPALCPRWAATGGDIYGNSPGMEALGDIKQLQHEQLRKGQVIDYKTQPPLQLPTSAKNSEIDTLPGGSTFVDMTSPNGGIKPAFDVNLDLSHLLEDIRDVRERVNSSFYTDLFLMLANDTRSGITATEVAERHEEKLLMLGPVLERQHNELLDPKIETTFSRMLEAGLVKPPPVEMHGMNLNVEFVSMLAQAQRAVGTNAVDRFVGTLGVIAQQKPDVVDRFDADYWVESYSDMLGVDPQLIVPADKVALIRKSRAQAAQAQAQAEALAQSAATVKNLAQARTDQPSALGDATAAFSGYA